MKEIPNISLGLVAKSLWIAFAIIITLYVATPIVMPIVFSVFAAIALIPASRWLEKKGISRTLSSILLISFLTLVITGILYLLFIQVQHLLDSLPDLSEKYDDLMNSLSITIEKKMEISAREQQEMIESNSSKFLSSNMDFVKGIISRLMNFLSFMAITPFYIVFMLIYRGNFRVGLRLLSKNSDQEIRNLTIIKNTESGLQNYLKGLLIVITVIAVLNAIGFLIIGLDYAILLAVIAALLTMIPYIGVFIGALLPCVIALITKDSLIYPVAVLGIAAVVQFLEGNFITPKVIGNQVGVNPLFIIMGVVIMGAIAGIIGMILAAPILAVIKIVSSNVDSWKPLSVIIDNQFQDYKTVAVVDKPSDESD